MLKYLLTSLCLLIATSAYSLEPPKRYDYKFPGKLEVYYSRKAVRDYCYGSIACAYLSFDKKRCIIYMQGKNSHIFRHENAHCNGWPWYHPR